MDYIEIGLQVNCNFRCSYCISEQQDHWSKLTSLDKDQLILWLKTHTTGNELVSLTGGEPFMWDGIEELVRSIPNRIIISTNLSMLHNNAWLFDGGINDRVCLRIGLHPTVRNDDYVEKIDLLEENGFHYIINYMVSSKEIDDDSYKDVICVLEQKKYNYEVSYEIDSSCGFSLQHHIPQTSHQFDTYNFIDQARGLVIRSNGNILRCQNGHKVLGKVQDNTLDDDIEHYPYYCFNCTSLKGFTKILSTWDKFDISTLFPEDSRIVDAMRSNIKTEFSKYQ